MEQLKFHNFFFAVWIFFSTVYCSYRLVQWMKAITSFPESSLYSHHYFGYMLVDCQPIFSSSVLEATISNERRVISDYANREDVCDAANMEQIMFILSVCHIVLVVESSFTDPNVHRCFFNTYYTCCLPVLFV